MCPKTVGERRLATLEEKAARLAAKGGRLPVEEQQELNSLKNQGKELKKKVALLVWEASK